jgi:hypothetical protein
MENPIAQVIGGLIAGFIAGFVGYTADLAIGAIFNAFSSILPALILFGAVYGLISFLAGISDAVIGGLFFSIGIMLTGFAVGDAVTILGGVIAIVALLLAFFKINYSD